MTDFELERMKGRQEEKKKEFKKVAAKSFPTFDFENDWVLTSYEVWDGEFTSKDGRKRIVVNTLNNYAFLTNTYYGHIIEDLEENGTEYTVVEGTLRDTVIEWRPGFATVQKFWKRDGTKVKGVKLLRDTHTNSKGQYVTMDRKRIYKGGK